MTGKEFHLKSKDIKIYPIYGRSYTTRMFDPVKYKEVFTLKNTELVFKVTNCYFHNGVFHGRKNASIECLLYEKYEE